MSEWYYAHGGEQKGPVPVSELQRLAGIGEFDPAADLVWRDGLDDWKPANLVEELAGAFEPAEAATAELNPYATPAAAEPAFGAGAGVGDLPKVKPANFGLCVTMLVIGTLGVIVSYGLMFASIISNAEDPAAFEQTMPLFMGGVFVSMIPLLIATVLTMIYLYRAWYVLQPHTAYSTPGKAVGFLFIPFFNLYWCFIAYWRWGQEWNRLVASSPAHPHAPRMSDGLFLTFPILTIVAGFLGIIGLIPYLIVQIMVIKGICNAVNYAAAR